MELVSEGRGWLIFFGVPLLLWIIGAGAAFKKGRNSPFFAYVAGSDHRLSLSRLQAFIWTLVIFGAFAAAMAVHSKIYTQAGVDKAIADAQAAAQKVEAAQKALDQTAGYSDKRKMLSVAQAEKQVADQAGAIAAQNLDNAQKALASASGNEEKKKALAVAQQEKEAADKTAAAAAQKVDSAQKALDQTPVAEDKKTALSVAQGEKETADKTVAAAGKITPWVNIPASLLALAGIAIASGVFSSLIAASTSEDKTACVTRIQSNSVLDPATAATVNTLVIDGQSLGDRGRVRFGRIMAPIRNWNSEGTQIQVVVPKQLLPAPPKMKFGPLVVDTPNGKLAYDLSGPADNLNLGAATSYYEFVDLFRDDKNPESLDLMKFQMFGWTAVAIFIYSYLFLTQLTNNLTALPSVPDGIVVLTGLSQTGYLAGKGVTNMK